MAPSKGGQAAKQQPQKQHQRQQTTTASSGSAASVPASQAASAIAKKPRAAAAAAAAGPAAAPVSRPAVVPAIPLPMIKRQTSSTKKIIGGSSNSSSNGSGNANNAASNRFNGSHNASRHVVSPATSSSGRPPVASLEAALIDHQTAAAVADETAIHRQRPRRSKQNELNVNANGTPVEKPALAAAATTDPHHNGDDHDNSSHYRNQLPSTPNGIVDTTISSGYGSVPENEQAIRAEHLTNGFANFALNHNSNDPTSASSSAFVHASNAPSIVGDVEVPTSLPPRELSNGNAHIPRGTQLVLSALPRCPSKQQTNLLSLGAANEAAAIAPSYHADSSGNSTDPHASSHPIFKANGTDTAVHHVPHPTTLYAHHYAHANGNGVLFGGVPTPDSHTPSPASGAFMPPPPLHRPLLGGVAVDGHKYMPPNGQHIHTSHVDNNGTNYAAPITPLRPGPDNMTSIDSYIPIPAPLSVHRAPLDGYPPNASHFEPPTPHSFHGSHASGDFSGPDNIASFRPNGHVFDRDPRNSRPHGIHPMPPFAAPQHFPRPPNMDAELLDSVMFFQTQFNSAELADCILELRFPDATQSPAKINAHKLILARSPALKQSIMIARASDAGSHIITFNATDRYLTSDSWFMAVQRLYLHPLFTPPFNANGTDFGVVNIAQFRFCLGYAAAGHSLEMSDVLLRGLQIAADMVQWHTIEEALSFALEGASHRHFIGEDGVDYTDIDFAYGRDVRILMMSITSFLITQFPPNFNLDTTVTDTHYFSRIPAAAAAAIQAPAESAPAIARGTSVRKLSKGNRLSAIKFGDLPADVPEEGIGATPREPAKCSALLSRILLNLPFEDLRYVLASESINAQAWNTAQDRHNALTFVVAEREARRLRAVEAVRARLVPGSDEIQQRLSASRRHDVADPWDVLNWQEKVIQPNGAGLPNLARKWIPQFGTTDEAPQMPAYEPRLHESMV
ncbi:hypothetical protein PFICI_15192 [Pestalotiopsis fici W106-1]|uniref:BTB domain-containing protein n=1 Tax=Pestalotiopsis fici (strain W106-1 / CGMCC3.15140) TaxID=1229662 RepID=W3WIN2_PESFW|nr:uncharacterized protein PFICI_15192 [Pestalotiopsis fici W106-1]ETS73017.1 hypothetical protein PFICI_15192 [Pestalotiopsis fici W106-1]